MNDANNQILVRRILELNRPMLPEPTGIDPQLSPVPGVKAVLFDIYGTLLTCGRGEIGSTASENNSMAQQALEDAGIRCLKPHTGERTIECLRHWIDTDLQQRQREGIEHPEVDIRKIWKRVLCDLVREELIEGNIGRHATSRLAVEYECRVNPAWPMPDLNATLQNLLNAGMKLGIVSNAQFYTLLLLEAFPETGWLAGFFKRELCVWSFELLEAKPSARLVRIILEHLAARYDISPAETLCVGNDMLNDITPAAQLGCKTALFAGDGKSLKFRKADPRCEGIRPDLVITHLAQLARIAHRNAGNSNI